MPGQTWRDTGHKALCPVSDERPDPLAELATWSEREVDKLGEVRDILVEMTGDRFHPFVCGHGRSLKPETRKPW
eukprot:COSAG02_NODE_37307_length_443_cov_1.351744_1_plen_73_part_01